MTPATKHIVSISLGSTDRDKAVEIELLGQRIHIERLGTDGDLRRAQRLFAELDGRVDAFGVGGIDLHVHTPWKNYPLRDAQRLIAGVRRTPITDGGGLKDTLEARTMRHVAARLDIAPKTALLVAAITRYGLTQSFIEAGYDCVFADFMFALGVPLPIRNFNTLRRCARLLLPVLGLMPIAWLYPTGEHQHAIVPKYQAFYARAGVIAGDWLYVQKHLPDRLDGKVVVTNTTTEADVAQLRQRGVRALITTTPVFDGRSFGTNVLEAALIAASGRGRALTTAELNDLIDALRLEPQLRLL